MPTYQYACTECAERLEVVQSFSDEPLTVCASCGGRIRRVFFPVGIVFKGSGFYRTDSRASKNGSEACWARRQRGEGRAGFGRGVVRRGQARRQVRCRQVRGQGRGQLVVGRRVVILVVGVFILIVVFFAGQVVRVLVFVIGGLVGLFRWLVVVRLESRLTAVAELASIGVIGGSGLYEFLDSAEEMHGRRRPYGPPSDPIVIGEVAGRRVAFLPRHGRDHRYPPHRIPYRANLWALRSVGVRQVLAPSAVGSLTAGLGPGTLVVPDQLVDRTGGREQTYYDTGGAVHVPFADPYCPAGRAVAVGAARADGLAAGRPRDAGGDTRDRGSPPGPSRAGTPAQGWTLIGMTGHPEAVLARELALCYTTIALVTDTDAGVEEGEGVTHAEVFRVFAANLVRLRDLLMQLIEELPAERDCPCPHALDDLPLPIELP